jgi:OHCU decarboxylase
MVVTLDEINALDREAFVIRLGFVAEDSPWVAYGAYDYHPFADPLELVAAFRGAIARAGERQLDLLRAHPDLAGRAAVAAELTPASTAEQRSAGLDRLTAAEYVLFHERNAAYRATFGIPFIVCVRDHTKASILAAYERRLGNDRDVEIAVALDEVVKIIRLRVADLLDQGA